VVRGVLSLDSQEHAINIYINEKNWKVYSILKNVGSAYHGDQKQLIDMLKSCKGKNLVVYEANRLSRNLGNFQKIYEICVKNKHKITIVNIGRTFECISKFDKDFSDLYELIRVAEKESRDMGERIRRTYLMKKEKEAPWGKTINNLGIFVNDVREQKSSLLIKLLSTKNSSFPEIVELINELGKMEGKEPFELIEYDTSGTVNDVKCRILPAAMSQRNILDTLNYYEIKHRNRKFNRDDIVGITTSTPTTSTPIPTSSESILPREQEWICIWYDPKIGLPRGVKTPSGFKLPSKACQLYIPK
jgi:DNA invertase Pin-like site-specific DNA recombinase